MNVNSERLYNVWKKMKQRCFNPQNKDYCYYGGRGITIASEWTHNYLTFKDWSIAHGYSENLVLDRINTNGNYDPNNCHFVSIKENNRNKRNGRLNASKVALVKALLNDGMKGVDICRMFGIKSNLLTAIKKGERWSDIKPSSQNNGVCQ